MIRSVSPEHVLKSETYTMVFLWCKFFYTSEPQILWITMPVPVCEEGNQMKQQEPLQISQKVVQAHRKRNVCLLIWKFSSLVFTH